MVHVAVLKVGAEQRRELKAIAECLSVFRRRRNLSLMLIVFGGLPGVGKSTLARGLGRSLHAPVLSVDPIEAALWRAGIAPQQPTGLAAYVVAEALAERQLEIGLTTVIDAANYVEPGRQMWRDLAARQSANRFAS
jgi:predicted kinase